MKRLAIALTFVCTVLPALTGCSGDKESRAEASVQPSSVQADWRPVFDIPLPDIVASTEPASIAAGEYLFHAVAHCNACHQPYAAMAFASPEQTRTFLPVGGHEWKMGEMGTIRSANITPDPVAGVGTWTDGELARAIKYAVGRNGNSIIFMNGLGYVDDRDVAAIVSYLRTLKPVAVKVSRTEITPAGRQFYNEQLQGFLKPRPQHPVPYAPPGEASVARGAYLANGPARCVHCHSNLNASPDITIDGSPFAGNLWPDPDPENPSLEINAPNLTPSERFGAITQWSEEAFLNRIRVGRAIKGSTMPWESFRLMTDADLISIYRYLKTLEPVDRNAGPPYRPAGWKPGR